VEQIGCGVQAASLPLPAACRQHFRRAEI
jgi:hypothetical protein